MGARPGVEAAPTPTGDASVADAKLIIFGHLVQQTTAALVPGRLPKKGSGAPGENSHAKDRPFSRVDFHAGCFCRKRRKSKETEGTATPTVWQGGRKDGGDKVTGEDSLSMRQFR